MSMDCKLIPVSSSSSWWVQNSLEPKTGAQRIVCPLVLAVLLCYSSSFCRQDWRYYHSMEEDRPAIRQPLSNLRRFLWRKQMKVETIMRQPFIQEHRIISSGWFLVLSVVGDTERVPLISPPPRS